MSPRMPSSRGVGGGGGKTLSRVGERVGPLQEEGKGRGGGEPR